MDRRDFLNKSVIGVTAVAAGSPCRVVRKRFDDEFIASQLDLKWWDRDIEMIESNFEALSSGVLLLIRKING